MGWIKRTGLSVVTIILLIALIISGTILTLTLSLRYEQVQTHLKEFAEKEIAKQATQEQIDQYYSFILKGCENQTSYQYQHPETGLNLTLQCSEVHTAGSEGFLNLAANQLVKDLYEKEYNCTPTTCFSTGKQIDMAFYISRQAQRTALKYEIISVIILLFITLLIFLLAETKISALIVTGVTIIVSSLAFFNFGIIFDCFMNLFIPKSDQSALQALIFIADNAKIVFFTYLVIGIILVISGIILWVINSKKKN
jgi:hypothetical protein